MMLSYELFSQIIFQPTIVQKDHCIKTASEEDFVLIHMLLWIYLNWNVQICLILHFKKIG